MAILAVLWPLFVLLSELNAFPVLSSGDFPRYPPTPYSLAIGCTLDIPSCLMLMHTVTRRDVNEEEVELEPYRDSLVLKYRFSWKLPARRRVKRASVFCLDAEKGISCQTQQLPLVESRACSGCIKSQSCVALSVLLPLYPSSPFHCFLLQGERYIGVTYSHSFAWNHAEMGPSMIPCERVGICNTNVLLSALLGAVPWDKAMSNEEKRGKRTLKVTACLSRTLLFLTGIRRLR